MIRRRDALDGYFAYQEPAPAPSPPPEGLLLLAHQAGGALFFKPDKDGIPIRPLTAGFLQRSFPPGSFVVLAACNGAGVDPKNRQVIDALNESEVDGIIAAPFQVLTSFAEELAKEVAARIWAWNDSPAPQPRTMSLPDLFELAANAAAARLEARRPRQILPGHALRVRNPGRPRHAPVLARWRRS